MNLLLLEPSDFIRADTVRLDGRRLLHIQSVHRAKPGQRLRVGLLGGPMGEGEILRLEAGALEMRVQCHEPPPAKLPLTLIVALPRPKVLNRVIASAASLGVARLVLINAWKVEKGYWTSPKLTEDNLRHQCVLGLEQSRDTCLPQIHVARLFKPWADKELPMLMKDAAGYVAHPGASAPCPRDLTSATVLAIGPEGGWIDAELNTLLQAGLQRVSMGPRILRTETALAALVGRMF